MPDAPLAEFGTIPAAQFWTERRIRLTLTTVLIVTFLIRFGIFWQSYARDPESIMTPDSPTYNWPAQALIQMGEFRSATNAEAPPELNRTPGYPVFIAVIYKLFGISRGPVITLQIALSVLSIYLTYWLGRKLFGSKLGLLAALFLALDPASLLYSMLMLTESIFTTVLMLALAAGWKWWKCDGRRAWLWAAMLGLLLTAAAYIRPIAYFLPWPVAIWMLFAGWRMLKRQTLGISVGVFLIISVAPLFAWQWRNGRVSDFHGFSAISGYSLLEYRAGGVIALHDHISFDEGRLKARALVPRAETMTPGARYAAQLAAAKPILRAHPLLMLRTQLTGLARMLFGPAEYWRYIYYPSPSISLSQTFRQLPMRDFIKFGLSQQFLLIAIITFNMIHISIVSAGLFAGMRMIFANPLRSSFHYLAIGAVIYLIALSAGPESHPRFRIVIEPLICIYAGLGLYAMMSRRHAQAAS